MMISKRQLVKKICIVVMAILIMISVSGCTSRSSRERDKMEEFETHLHWLSDSPEDNVEIPGAERYGYKFSEDALATLYCYIEEDWVSKADARESYKYLKKYIEALENEFDNVYEEYQSIY